MDMQFDSTCPVCAHTMSESHRDWRHICPDCGFEQSNFSPDVRGETERQVAYDRAKHEMAHEEMRRRIYGTILDYLSRVRPLKGATILDVGCGDGLFAKILFEKATGQIDTGIDFDIVELEKAKKTGMYKRLVNCSITDMPLQDNCYDTIFSNSVLEHIPNLDRAISEIGRILKPEGKLIFTVPSQYLSEHLFFSALLKMYH